MKEEDWVDKARDILAKIREKATEVDECLELTLEKDDLMRVNKLVGTMQTLNAELKECVQKIALCAYKNRMRQSELY